MKNIKKIFIISLALLAMSIFTFNLKQTKNASAEYDPSSSFNAVMATYNKTENSYTKNDVGGKYKNNTTFLLGANESIVVTLGLGEEREKISGLTSTLTKNGTTINLDSTNSLADQGLEKKESESFDSQLYSYILYINPSLITDQNVAFDYGKYTISFNYYYHSEEGTIPVGYSTSFYVLKSENYRTNLIWKNYDRVENSISYFYNFKNSNGIMYLSYNYKFVNVSISKSYQGLTTETAFNYNANGVVAITNINEVNAQTSVANVKYYINEDEEKLYIAFNDLGTYYLTYTYINPYYQNEVLTEFYANSPITTQTAFVAGSQAFYTTPNGLYEFKHTDDKMPYRIEEFSHSADITGKINKSNETLSILNSYTVSDVAKTNQAPVYFKSNAKLKYDGNTIPTSYYIYSADPNSVIDLNSFINSTENKQSYTGTPLTSPGLYFVCLNYEQDENSQYFLFRITNDAPSVNIFTAKYNTDGELQLDENQNPILDKTVGADTFTYKDIYVTKSALDIFDTVTTLTVYLDKDFNGSFEESLVVNDDEIVCLNKTAYYKLILSYGNGDKKGYTTYFTIDKSPIEEIEIKNTYLQGTKYLVASKLKNNMTSLPIAISWKEKASGATVTCEYKFFPTNYSMDYYNSLSSNDLKTLYNSDFNKYSIPSLHTFSYGGGNLPTSEYTNTYGKNALEDFDVLSDGGIYIFHIFDNTGAEGTYFYVFVDTTQNSILSVTKVNSVDIFNIAVEDEMTSKDTTLYFGKYKLIQMSNVSLALDSWFDKVDMKNMFATYQGVRYLKIEVNNKIYFTEDLTEIKQENLSEENDYGIKLLAVNNGVYNEKQYKFYSICASTVDPTITDNRTFDFYRNSFTASHLIEFTTDNTMLKPYFIESNNSNKILSKLTTKNFENGKVQYYNPTNATKIDKFFISYCTLPENGLEVESIILKYYAFEKNTQNGTYVFNNTETSQVTIYNQSGINNGRSISGNTYLYEINIEQLGLNNPRTASGKYEIIRTYTETSYASFGNESDPLQRNLTFIIDRNGIITQPDIDEFGNTTYYTGNGIFLQVVNNYSTFTNDQTLTFYDIYYATKMNEETPVLTTNLLPVTLYIPAYKYGYVKYQTNSGEKISPKFIPEKSVISYLNESGVEIVYEKYKLNATVYYYKNGLSGTITNTYKYDRIYGETNFLTTGSSGNSIISFNQAGYYVVEISSGAIDKNSLDSAFNFRFIFEIVYSAPEFKIQTVENQPINFANNSYYTNKETIRIEWEDSPNEFLAKINKNEIKLKVNNNTYKINSETIVADKNNANRYYVDINLKNINGYNFYIDNQNIEITLQFVGNEREYSQEYFSKTVTLKIDLQAPLVNITNLIKNTGLAFSDLRQYTQTDDYKYNISKNSGLAKHFAYTLDISNYNTILKTPEETNFDYYFIYYKIIDNKYQTGNEIETNIESEQYSSNVIYKDTKTFIDVLNYDNIGKYIELIEEDYAENRTVYSIFFVDSSNKLESNQTVIENNSKNMPEIDFTNLLALQEINLYNKSNFTITKIDDLYDDVKWSIISVNNKIYIKSPFTEDNYYQLNNYSENDENESFDINKLSLLQPSSNVQNITIYNLPLISQKNLNIYVLNKSLSFYKLSQRNFTDEEGILIKLPNENIENDIYATNLEIISHKNGSASEILNLSENIGNADCLKEITESKTIGPIELSYITMDNATYAKLKIVSTININDYFVYKIKDNYSEKYTVINIYGQTEVNEPITSNGIKIEPKYNQYGSPVYLSSETITYQFNTTIYESITVEVENESYNINFVNNDYSITDKNGSQIDKNNEKLNALFEINYNRATKIMTLNLLSKKYNFANNDIGGSRSFEIKLTKSNDFKEENEEDVIYLFEIFNEFPNGIELIGKKSAIVVNSILNGTAAYTDNIVINYVKKSLKYDYNPTILFPDGSVLDLKDGIELSEDGIYRIIINYLGLMEGNSKTFEFRISNADKFTYSVVKLLSDGTSKEIDSTDSGYTYTDNGAQITITKHYVLNNDYEIITNSSMGLKYEIIKTVDDYTKIYTISNLDTNNPLISNYFSTKIAITKIPTTNEIISRLFIPYGGTIKDQVNNLLVINNPTVTSYVTNKEQYDRGINITWSNHYLLNENIINVEVIYGDINGQVLSNLKTEISGNQTSLILKDPGVYFVKFTDLAGNTQFFGTNRDYQYLTIRYVSNVIFEINEESPINYAIYNSKVDISVPNSTVSYYDINSKPVINVELNGKKYTNYESIANTYKWSVNEPGIYKVWFSAKIDEKNIYETPIYFTILSESETRSSFSYNSYNNYYIEDILKDGKSVNLLLANENNGEMFDNNHLKNISISTNDIKTGVGKWTLIIKTNNNLDQLFKFSFTIKKTSVPIDISVKSGEKTTNNINIKFNTTNLLDEAGDCILKITGLNDLELTYEKLADGKLNNTYNLTLSKTGSYYIEITTLGGKLLYSYYVVKTEPLNFVSIIIIVVSTLVVVSGVVVFTILRKRMKIR